MVKWRQDQFHRVPTPTLAGIVTWFGGGRAYPKNKHHCKMRKLCRMCVIFVSFLRKLCRYLVSTCKYYHLRYLLETSPPLKITKYMCFILPSKSHESSLGAFNAHSVARLVKDCRLVLYLVMMGTLAR